MATLSIGIADLVPSILLPSQITDLSSPKCAVSPSRPSFVDRRDFSNYGILVFNDSLCRRFLDCLQLRIRRTVHHTVSSIILQSYNYGYVGREYL